MISKIIQFLYRLEYRRRRRLFAQQAVLGENCTITGKTIVNKNKKESVVIKDHASVGASIFCAREGTLHIGAYTWIGGNVIIRSARKVRIGEYCLIADNVIIQDNNTHPIGSQERRAYLEKEPGDWDIDCWYDSEIAEVTIGDNVWIGMNAIILKGVTVGEGSVIGAAAVVTKDVPANTVVAGNPARIVKTLK